MQARAGDKDVMLENPVTYSENETGKVFIWIGNNGNWFNPVSEAYVLSEGTNLSE